MRYSCLTIYLPLLEFQWLENIVSTALRKKSGEERQLSSKLGLPSSQPLVCFALCTGAFSDPVVNFSLLLLFILHDNEV
jgi:hypothetical protein